MIPIVMLDLEEDVSRCSRWVRTESRTTSAAVAWMIKAGQLQSKPSPASHDNRRSNRNSTLDHGDLQEVRDGDTARLDRDLAPDPPPSRSRRMYRVVKGVEWTDLRAVGVDVVKDLVAVLELVALCAVHERGGPGEEGVDFGERRRGRETPKGIETNVGRFGDCF